MGTDVPFLGSVRVDPTLAPRLRATPARREIRERTADQCTIGGTAKQNVLPGPQDVPPRRM